MSPSIYLLSLWVDWNIINWYAFSTTTIHTSPIPALTWKWLTTRFRKYKGIFNWCGRPWGGVAVDQWIPPPPSSTNVRIRKCFGRLMFWTFTRDTIRKSGRGGVCLQGRSVSSNRTKLDKRGNWGPKSHFLVKRLWWMTPNSQFYKQLWFHSKCISRLVIDIVM